MSNERGAGVGGGMALSIPPSIHRSPRFVLSTLLVVLTGFVGS